MTAVKVWCMHASYLSTAYQRLHSKGPGPAWRASCDSFHIYKSTYAAARSQPPLPRLFVPVPVQGTGATEEAEFSEAYGLAVVRVPPHRPSRRRDHPMQLYFYEEVGAAACTVDGAVLLRASACCCLQIR